MSPEHARLPHPEHSPRLFSIGLVYEARSTADRSTIYRFTVLDRTSRFLTVEDRWGEIRRIGVRRTDLGDEIALPQGRHAGAPVIYASRPADQ